MENAETIVAAPIFQSAVTAHVRFPSGQIIVDVEPIEPFGGMDMASRLETGLVVERDGVEMDLAGKFVRFERHWRAARSAEVTAHAGRGFKQIGICARPTPFAVFHAEKCGCG